MTIEPARRDDLPGAITLLETLGLPPDGLADHVGSMLVARQEGTLAGTAALEIYGDAALLRSVAIATPFQRRGLGLELTQAALQLARSRGIEEVFLLTTTAERFFPRVGFEVVSRADVPPAVQQSVEFTSACPASAIVMRKRL